MFVVLERDVEVVVAAELGRDVAYYAVSQAMIALGEQVAVCSVAEAGVAELALEALAVSDVVVHRLLFWALFDVTALHIKTKSVFFMLARKQI